MFLGLCAQQSSPLNTLRRVRASRGALSCCQCLWYSLILSAFQSYRVGGYHGKPPGPPCWGWHLSQETGTLHHTTHSITQTPAHAQMHAMQTDDHRTASCWRGRPTVRLEVTRCGLQCTLNCFLLMTTGTYRAVVVPREVHRFPPKYY